MLISVHISENCHSLHCKKKMLLRYKYFNKGNRINFVKSVEYVVETVNLIGLVDPTKSLKPA